MRTPPNIDAPTDESPFYTMLEDTIEREKSRVGYKWPQHITDSNVAS